MSKNIYITVALVFLSTLTFAQHAPHLNFWSRFSLVQPISEKLRTEVELQHRRQSDFSQQTTDIFDEKLLSSVRTWVHYQHKENLSFSFSPLAYYIHNRIIIKEEDKFASQKEIRFSLAADLKHEIVKNLWLIDRTCFEYRDFQNTDIDFIRMRNRLGVYYKFNEKWNAVCFEEVFLNVKGAAPTNFFDHERLAFLVNYKPSKHVRIETGYMFVSRLLRNTEELLHESNFLVHLYYTLPQRKLI